MHIPTRSELGAALTVGFLALGFGPGCKFASKNGDLHLPASITKDGFNENHSNPIKPLGRVGLIGAPIDQPTPRQLLELAKSSGIDSKSEVPKWMENCPTKFLPIEKFLQAECGSDGTMDRVGISKRGLYVDPSEKYRNPNADIHGGPVYVFMPGILTCGHEGLVEYAILLSQMTGTRVYILPNDQPEGIRPGKPPLPIGTALNGFRNAAAGQIHTRLGALREPSVTQLANLLEYLANPHPSSAQPAIPCVVAGHSQGTVNIMNAFGLLRIAHEDSPRELQKILSNVIRTELTGPAIDFYHEDIQNLIVRVHSEDWIRRASRLGVNLKEILTSAYEDGLGYGNPNGSSLREFSTLKELAAVSYIIAPGTSHDNFVYERNHHLFIINESYLTSKKECERAGRKWTPDEGAARAAKDLHDALKNGHCSPIVFLKGFDTMVLGYYSREHSSEARAFSREFYRMIPKDGAIGKYQLPSRNLSALEFLGE